MNLRSVSIYTDTLIKNGKLKMYFFGFGENSLQYYNMFVDVVDTIIEMPENCSSEEEQNVFEGDQIHTLRSNFI